VAAEEITETVKLGVRLLRVHDDSFERFADLVAESAKHGMCGFANGDDEDARIGVQVVQVITEAKDTALAVHVAFEGVIDSSLGQSVEE
jgi:hypothetical protein